MELHYPHKPYQITQPWGNPNPMYSEQFGDPNFKRHNGIDATVTFDPVTLKRATEYPVYCPAEGFRVTEVAYYPQGGGNQLGLMSKEQVIVGGRLCYVSILLCHAKKILVKVGDEPKVGQLLMIADSTGFSTGLHTHMGVYRLTDKYRKMDVNDATGSYDPALLFSRKFAVDVASYNTLFASALRYYAYVLTGV